MKMKHLLGLVALFCVITLSPVMAQGKHRHHAAIEQKADAQDDKDENVAYSDTTSTAFGMLPIPMLPTTTMIQRATPIP